jgi:hypothetical protein
MSVVLVNVTKLNVAPFQLKVPPLKETPAFVVDKLKIAVLGFTVRDGGPPVSASRYPKVKTEEPGLKVWAPVVEISRYGEVTANPFVVNIPASQ